MPPHCTVVTPTLASTWQFFLSEKRKSIQELTFLEGQKIGYKFPYYQPDEQVCIRVIRFICDVIIMMSRFRRFGVPLALTL